jgi:hypothetical protein
MGMTFPETDGQPLLLQASRPSMMMINRVTSSTEMPDLLSLVDMVWGWLQGGDAHSHPPQQIPCQLDARHVEA